MPTISVIVPVYKVEPYIHRCIDSILNQSYPDFELILVDDGSPDNCGAICDEYAEKDGRIHVIYQENGGLSAARNAGLDWVFANSDSQWVAFIDSDDWVHKDYLKILLEAATETRTNISVCGYIETTGEAPEIVPALQNFAVWKPEDFYIERNVNAIIACAKLYQKQLFSDIRYPNGKIHEDELTTYKLLFSQDSISVCPLQMYYYFQNREGISKSPWNPKRLDAIQGINEQALFFRENHFLRAYDFAADACIWLTIRQKDDVRKATFPKREQRKYIAILNRELYKAVREFYGVYAKSRVFYIYCEMLPVLKPLYWITSKIYHFLKWVRKFCKQLLRL